MTFRISAKGKTAEILIYEDIGDGWFGGLSAKRFADELKGLKAIDAIDVRINSYGGEVFDGVAIYNSLVNHGAKITTHVDGIAASIASVIAMAGSEIHIAENAWMMIHDPWGVAMGNASEMRKQADLLDSLRDTLVNTYTQHATIDKTAIAELMAAETWLSAADAHAKGFATHISQAQKAAAAALDPARLARFRNPPATASAKPAAINQATAVKAARMSQFIKSRGLRND